MHRTRSLNLLPEVGLMVPEHYILAPYETVRLNVKMVLGHEFFGGHKTTRPKVSNHGPCSLDPSCPKPYGLNPTPSSCSPKHMRKTLALPGFRLSGFRI